MLYKLSNNINTWVIVSSSPKLGYFKKALFLGYVSYSELLLGILYFLEDLPAKQVPSYSHSLASTENKNDKIYTTLNSKPKLLVQNSITRGCSQCYLNYYFRLNVCLTLCKYAYHTSVFHYGNRSRGLIIAALGEARSS